MKYLCFDTAVNGSFTLLQLQNEYPVQQCLFKDTKDAGIWDVAPWLFLTANNVYRRMDHPLALLKHAVFFESNEKMDDLRQHLQYFIYKTETGQEYFFRFWDARVLIKYLSSCTSEELEAFFGDVIEAIYIEDESRENMLCLTVNRKNKLAKSTITKQAFFQDSEISKQDEHKDPFSEPVIEPPGERKSSGGTTNRRKFLTD
jgi:Domain of unknown function (DUF4123)